MIRIEDEGIIVNIIRSGETGGVISILSHKHGLIKGFVSHISNKKNNNLYHISNKVKFVWQARVEENLGTFSISLLDGYAAKYITDKVMMSVLISATTLIYYAFKEREEVTEFYEATIDLFDNINPINYVLWEFLLLKTIGFGLDLTECAATGEKENLLYVSPKSGRAVSKEASMPYLDILLPLPQFLIGKKDEITVDDLKDAFNLSGYFLKKHIFEGRKFPEIRSILQDYLLL